MQQRPRSQQTPPLQWPLVHSAASEQASPLAMVDTAPASGICESAPRSAGDDPASSSFVDAPEELSPVTGAGDSFGAGTRLSGSGGARSRLLHAASEHKSQAQSQRDNPAPNRVQKMFNATSTFPITYVIAAVRGYLRTSHDASS